MTKPTKWVFAQRKTLISLGIRLVWSGFSLSAWRKLGSLATQWAHSEDSDQTGRMPRLIWVFAGRTAILLVLSCRSSTSCALIRLNTVCLLTATDDKVKVIVEIIQVNGLKVQLFCCACNSVYFWKQAKFCRFLHTKKILSQILKLSMAPLF